MLRPMNDPATNPAARKVQTRLALGGLIALASGMGQMIGPGAGGLAARPHRQLRRTEPDRGIGSGRLWPFVWPMREQGERRSAQG